MDFIIGRMDSPSSLNAYSTRGGTSGYTVRVMMPSASMERKLSVRNKTWDFNFDDSKHKDGSYYYFTRCPLNDFARKYGFWKYRSCH